MKLRLTILFVLDTLVLVFLSYVLFYNLEHGSDFLLIVFLLTGVCLSITAFLILYFKFLKLPLHDKKSKL
jgi:hypothetical protein